MPAISSPNPQEARERVRAITLINPQRHPNTKTWVKCPFPGAPPLDMCRNWLEFSPPNSFGSRVHLRYHYCDKVKEFFDLKTNSTYLVALGNLQPFHKLTQRFKITSSEYMKITTGHISAASTGHPGNSKPSGEVCIIFIAPKLLLILILIIK